MSARNVRRRSPFRRSTLPLHLLHLETRETPAAGGLDSAFDTDGRLAFAIPGSSQSFARDSAIDANGRIVVVGTASFAGNDNFAAARFNADGTLDTSFNSPNGFISFDFFGGDDQAEAVAIDGGGNIYLAGWSDYGGGASDFGIARLTPAGVLDVTFDGDGVLPVNVAGGGNFDRAYDIAIDGVGRPVIAGQATFTNSDFAVVRLKTDGTLDTDFDTDGIAVIDFAGGGGNSDFARGVAIGSGDSVIVVGTAQGSGNFDYGIAKLTSAGALDTSFNGTGKQIGFTTATGYSDEFGESVAIDASGNIVVAGRALSGGQTDAMIMRFTSAGARDATFATAGAGTEGDAVLLYSVATDDDPQAVAHDASGRIVVGGYVGSAGSRDFVATRITSAGVVETKFGTAGHATVDFGGDDQAFGLTLDALGRIVLTGQNGSANFAVARLQAVDLDVSIDGSGNLLIAGPAGQTDTITLTVVTPNYRVGDGVSFIDVPITSVTGSQILINAGNNNDTVIVTYGDADFADDIVINGDAGTDTATINGGAGKSGTAIAVTTEIIRLNGEITTTGDQTYTGPVTLTGDATVATTGTGTVGFTSTVNATAVGAQGLQVNSVGQATFAGAVGGSTRLGFFGVSSADTIRLGGNIQTEVAGGGSADVTFAGGGNVVLTANVTIDTEDGGNGASGSIDFGTSQVSGSAAGRILNLNTDRNSSSIDLAGSIKLAAFGNAGGFYVTSLNLTANNPSSNIRDGVMLLGGDILLDDNGSGTVANLTFNNDSNNVFLNADVTIDTEQGDDAAGGTVQFNGSDLGANGANFDLRIDTGTNAAGKDGGFIRLDFVNNNSAGGGGGFHLNDLTLNSHAGAGGTAGQLKFSSNVNLKAIGTTDPGDFTVEDNSGLIVLINSLTITAVPQSDVTHGSVHFGTSNVTATAGGRDLQVFTRSDSTTSFTNVTSGAITVNSIIDADGAGTAFFFINDLQLNADSNASGTVVDGAINLRGDIFTDNNTTDDGAIQIFPGSSQTRFDIPAGGTITFDTEQGDDANSGAVQIFGSRVVGLAAGIDLVVDTSTTGGSAGRIEVGTVNATAGGEFFLNDLTFFSGESVAVGKNFIQFGGTVNLDAEGADLASLTIVDGSGFVSFNAGVTIDTEQGNDADAGPVTFGTSKLTARGSGRDITVRTEAGTGFTAGTIHFNEIFDPANIVIGSTTFSFEYFNDLFLDTDGAGTAADITINGPIQTNNFGDAGDVTIDAGAKVIRVTSDLVIDTEFGDDTSAGVAQVLSTVSATSAGLDVTINTATNTGSSGSIDFGATDNSAGFFPNKLSLTTNGAGTDAIIALRAAVQLDFAGGEAADISFDTGTSRIVPAPNVGTLITLDTEFGGDDPAGGVAFLSAVRSSTAGSRDLTIDTGSAAAAGGNISLLGFDSSGGKFMRQVTLNTAGAGTADGTITLGGTIRLTAASGVGGDFTILPGSGPVVVTKSLDIDMENASPSGNVNFGTSPISASADGVNFRVLTDPTTGTSGNITLTALTNAAGFYFSDVAFDTDGGGTDGVITLTGDLLVDTDAADTDAGSIQLLTGGGGIIVAAPSVLIDTEQGGDDQSAAFGTDTVGITTSGPISAMSVGTDVTYSTATGAFDSGPIGIGSFTDGGGANKFFNDVTIDTSSTGANKGQITLNGATISLDDNGAGDAGDFTVVAGGGIVVLNSGTITLDTEQGDDADGGSVNFGTAAIGGSAGGRDLSINTSTAFAGGTGGAVTLPELGNPGGNFLNDVTVNTDGPTADGVITLTGNIQLNQSGDSAAFTIQGGGNVVLTASILIDTELGNDTVSGPIDFNTSVLSASVTGVTLTLDTQRNNLNALAGFVRLAGADNFGGQYLNAIAINTNNPNNNAQDGPVLVSGTIRLDNVGATPASFVVTGDTNNFSLEGDTVFDLEQGDDGPGGTFNVNSADISSLKPNSFDLTIDASTAAAGEAGGNATLDFFGNASTSLSGGNHVNDVSITTTGPAGAGTILLKASINLNDAAADPASFTAVGLVVIDTSLTLDTEQGNDGPGGAVDLGAATVSANAGSLNLTVNTNTTFAGGDGGAVTLGHFADGDDTGPLVKPQNVTVNTTAGSGGTFGDITAASGTAIDIDGTLTFTGNNVTLQDVTTSNDSVSVNARNAILLNGTVNVGNTNTKFQANQDATGNEGFTQTSGTSLLTTSTNGTGPNFTHVVRVNTAAGGSGDALLSLVQAGGGRILIETWVGGGAQSPTGGGAILDNNGPAANIAGTAVFLQANAGTGIGTAGDALDLSAGRIEATTGTGGFYLDFTGNATLGLGSPSNPGVVAFTSGDIVITANGTLTLSAETNSSGKTPESTFTASGDITLIANDMVIGHPVDAGTGTVSLQTFTAGRLIQLGNTSAAADLEITDAELNQITAGTLRVGKSDSGAISIGADVNVADNTTPIPVLSLITNGGVTATAGGVVVGQLAVTANGVVDFTDTTTDVDDLAIGNTGATTFTDADGFDIDTVDSVVGVSAGTATVTLEAGATTQSQPITAGAARLIGAGPFTLDDAGNAVGTLAANVGGALTFANTGALSVGTVTTVGVTAGDDVAVETTGALTLANSVTATGFAVLLGGNGVVDDNTIGFDVVAASAAFVVTSGGVNDVETDVDTLAILATAGGATVTNAGALSIGQVVVGSDTVTGITGGGAADVTATSPLTVNQSVIMSGDVTLTAGEIDDFPTCADALTVSSGFKVQSTGGSVTLRAGDDVVIQGSATVQANTAVALTAAFNDLDGCGTVINNGTVIAGTDIEICVEGDYAVADLTASGGTITIKASGAITDGNGAAMNLTAISVALSAGTGIGAGDALEMDVTHFAAVTTSGGVNVTNAKALTIGSVAAGCGLGTLNGVTATAGDVSLAADDMTISEAIDAGTSVVTIVPPTAATAVNFGGTGGLNLTDVELDNITAGTLRIGDTATGAATFHEDVDFTDTPTVTTFRLTAAGVTGTAGGVKVANLRITSTGDNAINLTDASTDVDAVSLTAGTGDVAFTDSDGFIIDTVDGQSGVSGNAVSLSAGGAVTDSQPIIATGLLLSGTGDYTLDAVGFAITTFAANTSGDVTLNESTGFTIGTVGGVDGVSSVTTLSLTAGGAVTQTKSVAVTNLLLSGAGPFTLDDAGNDFGTVASDTTNNLTLTDAGGFAVGSVNGVNGISIGANTLTLSAGGAVTQSQPITATAVELLGSGTYTFDHAGNAIDTLAANIGGGLTLTNTGDLTIGTVVVSGVTTGGDVNVQTTMQLSMAKPVSATSFGVLLKADSIVDAHTAGDDVVAASAAFVVTTGGVDLETDVDTLAVSATAGAVTIVNAGGLTIGEVVVGSDTVTGVSGGGSASITATSPLTVNANVVMTGDVTLTAGETDDDPICADDVTVNDGFQVQSTGGNVTLRAGDDVVISGSATVQANGSVALLAAFGDLDGCGTVVLAGTVIAGTDIEICVVGDLAVGSLTAAAGTITLKASGAISDGNGAAMNLTAISVALSAGTGIGAGDALEMDATNFAAVTTSGGVDVTNAKALTIGSVAAGCGLGTLSGVTATAGDVSLAADDMTISNAINAGTSVVTIAPLTAATAINFGGTGGLNLTDAELDNITAGTLRIGDTTSGAATFHEDVDFTDTPTITTFTLTAAGITGTAGGVKVANLRITSTGNNAINLTDASTDVNAVSLSAGTGDAAFTDSDDFVIDTIDGQTGVSGNAVTLSAGGTVTDSQPITATGLLLSGTGAYILDAAGFAITTFAANTTGDVTLDESTGFAIGTVNGVSGVANVGNLTLTAGGAVTQAKPVAVTNLVLRGAGPFTLDDTGNDFDNLVSDATGDVSAADGDGFDIGSIGPINGVNIGANTLTLKSGGAVTDSKPVIAANLLLRGSGPFTLDTATNNFGTIAGDAAGTIFVADANTLDIGTVSGIDGIAIGANTLTLSAVTVVTQSKPITAGALRLLGTAAYTLDNPANDIDTVAANASGALTLANTGNLTIGTVIATTGITVGGDVVVETTLQLALEKPVVASSFAVLLGGGSGIVDNHSAGPDVVATSAALVGGTGGVGAVGGLEIAVTTLAASATAGAIDLTNAGALTIGEVVVGSDTVSGISGGGSASVTATSPLTVNADVIMTGDVTLTAGETDDDPTCADDLTVTSGFQVQSTGGSVTLRAGDDVVISGSATVQANTAVALLAAFNDLDMCGTVIVNGTVIAGTDVEICVEGDFAVASFSAGGTITIKASGAITDGNGASINLTALSVALSAGTGIGAGDALEMDATNFAATTTSGGVNVNNAKTLTIGAVVAGCGLGTLNGVTATAGDVALAADDMTISHAINAGTSVVTIVPLTAATAINFGGTGGLNLTDAELDQITAGTLRIGDTSSGAATFHEGVDFTDTPTVTTFTLTAAGVTGTAGGVTVANLRITSTGNNAINLTDATTNVDTVSLSAGTGDAAFTDSDGFVIDVVDGQTGVSGNAVTLSPGGAVTDAQPIIAAGLLLSGTGTFILDATGFAISTLAANTTGNVTLDESTGFAIGTVNGVNGIAIGASTLTLTAGGAVVQSQSITATAVRLLGNGPYTLNNAGNDIDTLAANVGGSLTLANTGNLTIGTVGATNGVTTGGNVNIQTTLQLALEKPVTASSFAVLLSGGSGIVDNHSAGSDVVATSAALVGGTGGVGAVGGLEIAVTTLAASATSGAIDVTNAGGLTIGEVVVGSDTVTGVTGGGSASITATSPLTVNANVVMTGDVTLTAGEIDDDPTCADDLTVNSGVTVQSTGGSVTLRAGDDVSITLGATVDGKTAVSLFAGFNDADNCGDVFPLGTVSSGGDLSICTVGDLPVGTLTAVGTVSLKSISGAITDANGAAVNVTAAALALGAATGIGVGDALEIQVANLEAASATGGIFLANDSAALELGGVSPGCDLVLTGVRATTSGDVSVTNTGGISVTTAGDEIQAVSGSVTLSGSAVTLGTAVSASATVTLTATTGAISDSTDLVAGTTVNAMKLVATAATGIELDTNVGEVQATTTDSAITLREVDGVSVVGTGLSSGTGLITPSSFDGSSTFTLTVADAIADASPVSVASGTTLDLNGDDETIGSLEGAGPVLLGNKSLFTGGNNGSTTYSGVLSGTGGMLVKQGTGTFTLTGGNTFTGTTFVNAGTLALGVNNALSTSTSLQVNGGTFDVATFTQTVAGLLLMTGSVSGTTGVLTSATNFDLRSGTASAILAGAVGLVKQGTGTAAISGANTYTGSTSITSDTLALGANDAVPNGSIVIVNGATAVFAIVSFNDTVAGLQLLNGQVTGTTGALTSTTAYDVRNGTVSAKLAGSVGLVKSTGDTVTLSGANVYTGTTSVNGGTLALTGSLSGAGGAIELNANGVVLDGGGTGTVNGRGVVVNAGKTGVTVQGLAGITHGTADVGLTVAAGATAMLLNNTIAGNKIGVLVNGGTALVQGNNLSNNTGTGTNSAAGLQAQNGAIVDAGQLASSAEFYGPPNFPMGITGLGVSTGGNTFLGYTAYTASSPAPVPTVPQAIRNLNTGAAPFAKVTPEILTNYSDAFPLLGRMDLPAQNNTFGNGTAVTDPAAIEGLIYHDLDNAAYGFVAYGSGGGGSAPTVLQVRYNAGAATFDSAVADPAFPIANGGTSAQAAGQKSRIGRIEFQFNGFAFFPLGSNAAISLQRTYLGATTPVTTNVVSQNYNNTTAVTTVVVTFSGANTQAGSLADGIYRLQLDSANITGGPGGPELADTFDATFWRLFGDSSTGAGGTSPGLNGNLQVTNADRTAFLAAYGGRVGSAKYRRFFDFNNNGVIDATDNAEFNLRFGKRIDPVTGNLVTVSKTLP